MISFPVSLAVPTAAMRFIRFGAIFSRQLAAVGLGAVLLVPGTLSGAEPLRLLAFGDSLTHGYGLVDGETFPEQLEAALKEAGHDVIVINSGNSGDTTASGRARLDWALADNPDAVIVELGANDGLRGLDPAQTFANLDAILARFEKESIPVLLAGMLAPRNLGKDYTEEFDAAYPRLAEKYKVALYPFFLDGVVQNEKLNQTDGIHPNSEGVAIIVSKILPQVEKLLRQARQAESHNGG